MLPSYRTILSTTVNVNLVSSFTRMSCTTSTVDLSNRPISDWYELFGSYTHLVVEYFYPTRIVYSDIHYANR